MRWLLVVVVLLAVAIGGALMLQQYPGYVHVEVGPWMLETSLAFLVAVLVVGFVLLYALLRLLGFVVRTPRSLRRGLFGRRIERSRRGLTRGLIEMAEGRWQQAEKMLTRHAPDSGTALLHYLAAARAAQQIGAYERRDAYLKQAIEANPEADIAVSLTQAELQIAHRQTEHALATLTRLRGLAPRHSYVMKLLARLYADTEDWQRLAELVPELRRARALQRERIDRLERQAALGRLGEPNQDPADLRAIWDSLSRRMRQDPAIVQCYAERLIEAGEHESAERRVRQALSRGWDEGLARLYGRIRHPDAAQQLSHAEGWLRHHGSSPMLLLTLGRLCVRKELWGKARSYFESSIGAGERAETYFEFAGMLDDLGEFGAAREHYRAGLALAVAREPAAASGSADRAQGQAAEAPPEPALLPDAR